MQRRLAEVIALLEGDELTAEEQAKARKTLQDIVTQLRNPRPSPARRTAPEGEPPAPAAAPRAPRPPKEGKAETRRFWAGQAPAAPLTPETPKTRRAYVGNWPADRDAAARTYTDVTKAFGEARRAYAEQEGQARRVYTGPGLDAEPLRTSVARARADATRAAAGADEARAHAEGLRGRPGVGADTAPVRAKLPSRARAADADESEIRAMIDEMRQEMREIRSLMQRIRQQANDEDEENDESDENEAPHSRFYPTPGASSFAAPGQPPAPAPGQPFVSSPGLPPAELPSQPPVPAAPSTFGSGGDNPRQ